MRSCGLHPNARAIDTCPMCGRGICAICNRDRGPGRLCAECFASLPGTPCPKCGAKNLDDAERCHACSFGLRPAEPDEREAAPAEAPEPETPQPIRQPAESEPTPADDNAERIRRGLGLLVSLVLLVLVPLIAFGVAILAEATLDGTVRTTAFSPLQNGRGPGTTAPSLEAVCADASASLRIEACTPYQVTRLMEQGAILAVGLGFAILAFSTIAGFVARLHRLLLLVLFGPGLYLTIGGLLGLILLHGGLALGVAYLLLQVLGGRLPVFIVLGLGFGAIYGVINVTRVTAGALQQFAVPVVGKVLAEPDHPALWAFVRRLATAVGTAPPATILAGLEPNFFVTEARVVCLDSAVRGRTLYLSLPLSRILSKDELGAVLAHELAHFRGLDTRFSQAFYPIYRGTAGSLAVLEDQMNLGGLLHQVSLLPASQLLSHFLHAFAGAESKISRDRELAADRLAAKHGDRQSTASMLVKVHAFAKGWDQIERQIRQAIAQARSVPNASLSFARLVQASSAPASLEGLDQLRQPHPTDSHPPLHQRLEALGVCLSDVAESALATTPDPPAIDLITDHEAIELELTNVTHEIMIESGRAIKGVALRR